MNTLSDRLRLLRKALKLTQATFAEPIGLKRNTVAQYEAHCKIPSTPTLRAICITFGVNSNWLENGEGDMFVDELSSLEAKYRHSGGLSDIERKIISAYLDLDSKGRQIFVEYLVNLINKVQEDKS